MIDCSHGNSGKDPARQPEVLRNVVAQRVSGTDSIIGAMLESNLVAGCQPFPGPSSSLVYGQSITDACIDWETTERIVLEVAEKCPKAAPVLIGSYLAEWKNSPRMTRMGADKKLKWRRPGSNRQPRTCKARALPIELRPLRNFMATSFYSAKPQARRAPHGPRLVRF